MDTQETSTKKVVFDGKGNWDIYEYSEWMLTLKEENKNFKYNVLYKGKTIETNINFDYLEFFLTDCFIMYQEDENFEVVNYYRCKMITYQFIRVQE